MTTTETMHTPGPWGEKFINGRWLIVAKNASPSAVAEIIGYDHDAYTHANASLITAAPDLLEALQHLMDRYAFDGVPEDADNQWREAEAALVKALGS